MLNTWRNTWAAEAEGEVVEKVDAAHLGCCLLLPTYISLLTPFPLKLEDIQCAIMNMGSRSRKEGGESRCSSPWLMPAWSGLTWCLAKWRLARPSHLPPTIQTGRYRPCTLMCPGARAQKSTSCRPLSISNS